MAYQRQLFTRKRVLSIPNTAYPRLPIRRIQLDNYAEIWNSIDDDRTKRLYLRYSKNCISNDNEWRMIERNFVEIQGTFLVKIRDNTWQLEKTCAASEWFKNDCIGSVNTLEDLVEKFIQKFYQPSYDNKEIVAEEDGDLDAIADIFKIEGTGTYEEYEMNNPITRDLEGPWLDNGVPYQLCDQICKPYCFKNGVPKWPTCSSGIDGFCNSGELPGMVQVRNMTYFQDHKWYDELADGKLKEETLMHKAKVKES
ncbi:hypothetical protein Tco_0702777 [Tanacetum coccineum]|uniref:Uncharacterized protein n=1 Tax=Tanacetum coccineum TaxID=301880 RepID=A0ABQ4XXU5_9ASTR